MLASFRLECLATFVPERLKTNVTSRAKSITKKIDTQRWQSCGIKFCQILTVLGRQESKLGKLFHTSSLTVLAKLLLSARMKRSVATPSISTRKVWSLRFYGAQSVETATLVFTAVGLTLSSCASLKQTWSTKECRVTMHPSLSNFWLMATSQRISLPSMTCDLPTRGTFLQKRFTAGCSETMAMLSGMTTKWS